MQEFHFDLVLSGVNELTDEIANALFEAGCDDGTSSLQGGEFRIGFDREANSFAEAVISAIRDVESAGIGAHVARVEPTDIVGVSEIARRINRTRESVRLYTLAERGPGGFPPAIAEGLWYWFDVSRWLEKHMTQTIPHVGVDLEGAKTAASINSILTLKRMRTSQVELAKMWEEIPEYV